VKPIDDSLQSPSRKKQRISERGDAEVTNTSSDDSRDRAQMNVSLITHNIGGTVARLFRLSNAIRKSAKEKRTSRMWRYRGDEEVNNAITGFYLYTEYYIRFWFPQAPEPLHSA
jgi:hypothetical protein